MDSVFWTETTQSNCSCFGFNLSEHSPKALEIFAFDHLLLLEIFIRATAGHLLWSTIHLDYPFVHQQKRTIFFSELISLLLFIMQNCKSVTDYSFSNAAFLSFKSL